MQQRAAAVSAQLASQAEDFTVSDKPLCRYLEGGDLTWLVSQLGLERCIDVAADTLMRVDNANISEQVELDKLAATSLYLECISFAPNTDNEMKDGAPLLCATFTLATWYLSVIAVFPPDLYKLHITHVAQKHEAQYCLDGLTHALDGWFTFEKASFVSAQDASFVQMMNVVRRYDFHRCVVVCASRLWYFHICNSLYGPQTSFVS